MALLTKGDAPYRWDSRCQQVERGFLRLVAKKVRKRGLGESKAANEAILSRAADIFADNRDLIVDEPAQFHLLMTAYLLAAVQHLETMTDAATAQSLAGDAFCENGRSIIKLSFKASLLFARDKFRFIRENSGDAVVKAYGEGFDIQLETDDSSFLNTQVHRCGFHEFFKRNGRPELTRLMCRWDNNWSDVLDGNRQIDFDRPTTIAEGDSICDFRFKIRR